MNAGSRRSPWWEVAIWDTAGNRLERLLTLPAGGLADNAALAFSPDGGELVIHNARSPALDRESGRRSTLWTNLPAGPAGISIALIRSLHC